MTRIMGDATHDSVPQLAAIRSRLQLAAGYDTGSPDIDWTAGDVAQFPGIPVLMIDQGFTGSPNLKANIRDVEFQAWTPGKAVDRTGWNVPRPTIYCTLRETGYGLLTTPGVLADGWNGDLWLSIPDWKPGDALPATPGCTIVAVQNDFSNTNYDLSAVLDPTWPEAKMIPDKPSDVLQTLSMWSNPDGSLAWLYVATDGFAYTRFDPGFKGWGPAVRVA